MLTIAIYRVPSQPLRLSSKALRVPPGRSARSSSPRAAAKALALIAIGLVLATRPGLAAPGQTYEEARHHWAFQPIRSPKPPKVRNQALVESPIDAFLLSRLESKGLSFTPRADPRTLLRRVYYDLIGLPPTFEDIQSFLHDSRPAAFARVVDRLLASPQYGERWGRHWLDVARYADTKDLVLAYGKDALRPFAYTYRDYVIRAFNEDLPFNLFIQDQLAADLVKPSLPRWRLAALGFLTLGRLFDNNPHDQIDDQIDTTTRGFLALTVACARCHDHKYDAITQQDYYGLYGVFASTERPYDLPLLEDPQKVPGGPEFEQRLANARRELEQHIDTEFIRLTESSRQRVGEYLLRAATTKPDITETTQFALSLTPEDYRPALMQRTRRWLDQHATPADPVFGLWAQLMALPDDDFRSQATNLLRQDFHAKVPQPNPLVLAALLNANFTNKSAVASAYGQLLKDAYNSAKRICGTNLLSATNQDQSELLEIVIGEHGPIWFPRRDTPDHMSRPEKDRYNSLIANLDKLAANATNAPPARAMVVADLPEPIQPHIYKRGNPARPGDTVPRAFVRVLNGGQPLVFTNGSGRWELAQAISSPTNPLTARVFVNRVWMEHFGEPLVASTTDFGVRCAPPSPPELLDWLAAEFIRSGWSVKHLHRVMVLSRAYQQAPAVVAVASAPEEGPATHSHPSHWAGPPDDPDNHLLSHFSRRRLDFEAMRDSLLFVSGRLDPTLGGRAEDLAADPLNRRRTVYGLVDRQNLPALYRAFDFAVPDQCVERRPQTTVPQQALFALNSPFVQEQARALAALTNATESLAPAARVDALFRRVLGRHATRLETNSVLNFIHEAQAAEPDRTGKTGLDPWEQFAQVLLISNEAVFVD